ncbi:MAG TPA: NUDIX domain-containing protein [Methylomirabilota bacterium]|jgi:predicted NUDIX family NTP pyrophosphohydrolase|nr:NUDIX domain-containing protein [Methylomirabilota bacterium]
MPKRSAGLLMYRRREGHVEVLLVHPGGPFWMKKDAGAWSIPKGEYDEGEDAFAAATREFQEETGLVAQGPFLPLAQARQSGKIIQAWAFEGDCQPESLRSSTFALEWPPRSGRRQEFPEVDRAEWFGLEEARRKIIPGQVALLDELAAKVV